jgi:hypothetical protein
MFRISTYNSDKISFRGGHIVGHRPVISLIVRCSFVISLVVSLVGGLVGCSSLVVRLIISFCLVVGLVGCSGLVVRLIISFCLVVGLVGRSGLVVRLVVRLVVGLIVGLVVGLIVGLVVRFIVGLVIRLIMVNLVSQSVTIQNIRNITPHRRGVVFHVCFPYCRPEA